MDDSQRNQLIAVLTIGADRPTAAAYCHLTAAELETEIAADESLRLDVARAEATAELKHLRTVHHAVEDPKNWRASMWWLRSRHPDRYGRKPDTVTDSDLEKFTDELIAAVADELGEKDTGAIRRRIEALLAHNPQQ